MAVCPAVSTASAATAGTPQYMFVRIADDVKVDASAKTFRLVNVNQKTLYFSDRPIRIAGHFKMDALLKEWTAKAGKDDFGQHPPNGVLSVYEQGQPDSTTAVVEITQPKIDGSDLVNNYKRIEGSLPVAARPRCSSIGSKSRAALAPAFKASALGSAVPVCDNCRRPPTVSQRTPLSYRAGNVLFFPADGAGFFSSDRLHLQFRENSTDFRNRIDSNLDRSISQFLSVVKILRF